MWGAERQRRGRLHPLLVLLLVVLAAGCGPEDQSSLVLDAESGRPAIRVVLCEKQSITSVRLLASTYDRDSFERTDGEVLWEIASEPSDVERSSVIITEIVVGDTPEGFQEIVPLNAYDLPQQMTLFASIPGSESGSRNGSSFTMDNLSTDRLFGYHRSDDDLRLQGGATCHPGILNRMGLLVDDPSWLGALLTTLAVGIVLLGGMLLVRARRRRRTTMP